MRNRPSHDRGSVLPLALVFVVVLSLLATAIATYTATALRASDVTVKTVDRIASAESGATHALQATAGADACAGYSAIINDASVTATCDFQRRAVNADGLYAMVITDLGVGSYPELDTRTCPNPNCTRRVSGPVYLDQNVDLDLAETQAVFPGTAPAFTGGNVSFNPPGGDCAAPSVESLRTTIRDEWDSIDEANGGTDVTPFVFCDARGWEFVAPTPDLTGLTIPATTVTSNPGTCTTFAPGTLTGGTLDVTTDAFFASGVYLFQDVTIRLRKSSGPGTLQMTVGTRSDAAYQPTAVSSSCASAASADTGDGAVWILAGTSTIEFDKVTVDFYPKDLGAPGTDLDVSLLSSHIAVGPVPVTTLNPTSQPLITRKNPTQTKYSFHGQVYAPASWITTDHASNAAVLEFLGGVVVARFDLDSSANVDGINISVPVDTYDYYLIESTASNDGDTTVRVVAFDDGQGAGLQVESWRVCAREGC